MAKFHYKESPTPKQKKTFAKYLSEDEDLVLVTGLSKAYTRSKFVIYLLFPGLLFFALGLGLGWLLGLSKVWATSLATIFLVLVAILKTMHIYHANRYLLTTKRVIIKKGLFSVRLTATLYDKITHIEVDQTFVDRFLFHHGNIIVNTAGVSKGEIVLRFVDYPIELKNLLERLINKEREQLGLKTGPVTTLEGEIISH